MGTFSASVKAFSGKALRCLDEALQEAAIEFFTRVVMRSPVDTGRFRGNWQVGINRAPQGVLKTPDPSGGPTIARGVEVIRRAQTGDTIFIVNNVSYGPALEYGHSLKAPNGMVRVTAMEFPHIIQDALKDVARR